VRKASREIGGSHPFQFGDDPREASLRIREAGVDLVLCTDAFSMSKPRTCDKISAGPLGKVENHSRKE
jgi:hypothetical protein